MGADKRFFFRMDTQVEAQVGFAGKALAAALMEAGPRPFLSVHKPQVAYSGALAAKPGTTVCFRADKERQRTWWCSGGRVVQGRGLCPGESCGIRHHKRVDFRCL